LRVDLDNLCHQSETRRRSRYHPHATLYVLTLYVAKILCFLACLNEATTNCWKNKIHANSRSSGDDSVRLGFKHPRAIHVVDVLYEAIHADDSFR
ncbi:hypothetical protein M514_13791, partial [Trichuris suis]